MPTITKINNLVTDSKELPPVKSYDPLITRSCGVTWQFKYVIPPLTSKNGKVVT